jgi:hypothetical protein
MSNPAHMQGVPSHVEQSRTGLKGVMLQATQTHDEQLNNLFLKYRQNLCSVMRLARLHLEALCHVHSSTITSIHE